MMRIGLNGWFFDQGQVGSGQYVGNLWRALAATGELSCLRFQQSGGDVSVPLRAGGPAGKVWFEQVDLPRAARRRVDILHYPYFAAPLIKPCPVVVTIHDLIPLLFPEYSANPSVKLYDALIVAAARRADAIIAVSEHTRRDIMTHLRIPGERIHVTYEAPAPHFRRQDEAAVAAVRQRYGLSRYIFYIGGLNRHKNVQTLLAAYAQIRKELPSPPQLVIAGKAHSANSAIYPDLRPLAHDFGLTWAEGSAANPAHVRMLGFVDEADKPALYSGADLFIYPSLYEGFGFCPLEAMAAGAPVVSSRAASLAEVVGDGGILVEPTDVRAIASAAIAVLSDPTLASDLRARGLRQAARFTWARTAAQTADVYRAVCPLPYIDLGYGG